MSNFVSPPAELVVYYIKLLHDTLISDNSTAIKYSKRVSEATFRAAELTDKLLTYAQHGKIIMTHVDINTIVTDTKRLLEQTIDKKISIILELYKDKTTVIGDYNQLQSAVLNLAINARDAMPDGGKLTFKTSIIEVDNDFINKRPYKMKTGQYISLLVTDTGIGMDNHTKTRVFDPFFSTKESEKDTGLGLATVYGTIKGYGGCIETYSELNSGTTFEILIPFSDYKPNTIDNYSSNVYEGKGNILLIDDEPLISDMASDILTKLGYTVSASTDGEQAVEHYKEHYKNIDLVVIDIIMPKLGGLDCFLLLKKINPQIKAIFCSGYALKTEIQRSLDQGALAFVKKPFTRENLSKIISDILLDNISI